MLQAYTGKQESVKEEQFSKGGKDARKVWNSDLSISRPLIFLKI